MLELKLVEDGENKHINLWGFYYDIVSEARGMRDKFWLKKEVGNLLYEDLKKTNILFKTDRNEVTCDSWGEVIASRIGKQLGMNMVDYYLAEYDDGETKHKGVVCGSFFLSDKQYEMSVRDLQTIYTSCCINKETFEVDKPLNTVYSICEDLDTIMDFPKERKEKVLKRIKIELLKQCLFDYVLMQTDRHWQNTTFLVYEKDGEVYITNAACYDNGNMCFLQKKLASIKGISVQIGKDPINSPLLNTFMAKYIPVFGVKTCTARLLEGSACLGGIKMMSGDVSLKGAFIDELTDEIINEPELMSFYEKIRDEFSMDLLVKDIRRDGDEPPPEIIKMVSDVMAYQVNSIEKVLRPKLDKINVEERAGK